MHIIGTRPLLRTISVIVLLLATTSGSAQFSGELAFGKNKVQYERFRWKYIQSDNFDVYFHENGDYTARFTAMMAEKALRKIQHELSFSITKRIAFIVYGSHNQFEQTNVIDEFMSEGIGGVTELFKNRIVIPFEGDYAKFAHVIHHELVHAVINDMFYGGSVQSLVSNNPRAMLPLWMNEGFAEYSSVGGLDVKTDQFMRDVAVSEYLKGLKQLNGYFAYRGGQAFWSYVAQKYGPEKVGEVLNRFRTLGDVNQTFVAAFGLNFEDMSDQWAKDTKKFYFPDVDRYEYVEDWATRLTNHQKEENFYNTSPAISPDGEQVAFISDRSDGVFGLYVMNLATKDVRKLVSSNRTTDFEELNFLTPGISWNPEGTKLAVGAKAGGQDAIYIFDTKTNTYTTLSLGFNTIGGVHWSPDGQYLAFDATFKNVQNDIFLYTLATGDVRQLTNDIFTDTEPVWSPDGKRVYFLSDRGSRLSGTETSENFKMWDYDVAQKDIYSISINGDSLQRITTDPTVGKYSLAVAPDNESILYTADYNGITNLWEINLTTGERRARSNSLQEVSQISLSGDGTKLLFSSQNRVGYDLFLVTFPFDLPLHDTLPLTKYRSLQLEEKNSLAAIMDHQADTTNTAEFAYGTFDVDFGTGNTVQPNTRVIQPLPADSSVQDSTGDFTVQDYKVAFSPDIITGAAGYSNWFGAQGVAQMLFSDMLGDHELYVMLNLFLDLENSNFYVQYNYKPLVVDYSLAVFHNAGYSYVANASYLYLNRFRTYGMYSSMSVPFSRYSRIDFGLQVQAMSRENIDDPRMPGLTRFVTVPSVSYVVDDAIWGFWAPINGTRFNVTLEGSPQIGTTGLSFGTLRTDARQYVHLGGMYTLALRGSGGYSLGRDPQKFFIGGVDNWFNRFFSGAGWPFQNPEDFAFTRPGWPLRGYALNERNGSQYFVANAELRFPLFFAFQAGPLPSLLQGLQGQIFFDAGGAWDNNGIPGVSVDNIRIAAPDPILYSTGFGIRSLALGLPLRFDVAWRHEPTGGMSSPYYLFSLGGDF